MLRLVSVQSSNVECVGHADAELFVKYKSGDAVYNYSPISDETYGELLSAPSKDQFLRARTRHDDIKCVKLTAVDVAARGIVLPDAVATA